VEIVFQVSDYKGIMVTLSREVWEDKITAPHPGGHPEVVPYLDEIQKAIAAPDVVIESAHRQDVQLFYRLGVGVGRYDGLHVVVVVKYVQEVEGVQGYVSTVYLTRKLYSTGRILWIKPTLLIT
jgi:hypothetical protein